MADEQKSEQKLSVRDQRQKDRLERMRKMNQTPRVRVVPKDDVIRSIMSHPSGMSFPETGSVEWPDDTFTRRRIADGDVTIEQPKEDHAQKSKRDA